MPPRTVHAGPSDADLVAAYKAGDTSAADALLRRHEMLIWRFVHKLKLPAWIERDDMFQEACIGFWNAVGKWKPDAGSKFTTYASQCVWNALMKALETETRKGGKLQEATELAAGGNGDVLHSVLAPEPVEVDPGVGKWLAELTPSQRLVVEMRHGLHGEIANWRVVGKATGLSIPAARKLYEQTLAAV